MSVNIQLKEPGTCRSYTISELVRDFKGKFFVDDEGDLFFVANGVLSFRSCNFKADVSSNQYVFKVDRFIDVDIKEL